MAMINCPECGRRISDQADACPGCGISQIKIQDMLASSGQPNAEKSEATMVKCTVCHRPISSEDGMVCRRCDYPVLTLIKDKKKVKKAVKDYQLMQIGYFSGKPEDTDKDKKQEPLKKEKLAEKKVEKSTEKPAGKSPEKNGGKLPALLITVTCLALIAGGAKLATSIKHKEDTKTASVKTMSNEADSGQTFSTDSIVDTNSELDDSSSVVSGSEFDDTAAVVSVSEVQTISEVDPGIIEKGDIISFGSYEQDNNLDNGAEDIEWRVLDVQDGKALLVSDKALDTKRYNDSYEATTWEGCSLREWLNGEFLDTAFTSQEKAKIPLTKVTADNNPDYSTDPGNDTEDQVFLLSIQEAEEYFNDDDDRKAYPTESAKNNGAYVNDSTKCCWWWLRSPGYDSLSAARVRSDGWVFNFGSTVDDAYVCVRPALWVNL